MNLEDMSVLHRLMPYLGVSEKKREQVEEALSLRFSCMEELLLASRASLAEAGISEGGAVLLHLILPATRAARRGRYMRERPVCDSAEKLGEIFCAFLRHLTEEHVAVALLDEEFRLFRLLDVSSGTATSAPVVLRRLAEIALRENAAFVVMAHNHPGGETKASPEDLDTTLAVKRCLDSLGTPLLEHFVVAEDRYLPLLIGMPSSPICGKINPLSFYDRSARQRAGLEY
jgi:DNA repair protein RadC